MISGLPPGIHADIGQAREALGLVPDLAARCRAVGLPVPGETFGYLGRRIRLLTLRSGLTACDANTDEPLPERDTLLVLEYLLCDTVPTNGQANALPPDAPPASFRRFPGGALSIGPYKIRTSERLIETFANDLDLLRSRLDRLPWTPVPYGDLGARIPALGVVDLFLVYHQGEAPFPPQADVLFAPAALLTITADHAAYLGERLCNLLIEND